MDENLLLGLAQDIAYNARLLEEYMEENDLGHVEATLQDVEKWVAALRTLLDEMSEQAEDAKNQA